MAAGLAAAPLLNNAGFLYVAGTDQANEISIIQEDGYVKVILDPRE